MKRHVFLIDHNQLKWMFAPIRTRSDLLLLLLKTIKDILIYTPPPESMIAGSIVLQVSRMSRLFYISNDKVFSINFPFYTNQEPHGLSFSSRSCHACVDNKMTSIIIELLLEESLFNSPNILDFAEPIDMATSLSQEPDVWHILRDLLILEEGYIRYDADQEREKGHLHPLHHIDVFYSSSSTFKIGLKKPLKIEDFEDILDSTTDCHYLRRHFDR